MIIDAKARAQVVKDLRDTADLIEKNGWIQGVYFEPRDGVPNRECRVCSAGGLHAVVAGEPEPTDSDWATVQRYTAAKAAMGNYLDRSVISWNDAPGQTAEEVIKTFRLVADRAEAGEL